MRLDERQHGGRILRDRPGAVRDRAGEGCRQQRRMHPDLGATRPKNGSGRRHHTRQQALRVANRGPSVRGGCRSDPAGPSRRHEANRRMPGARCGVAHRGGDPRRDSASARQQQNRAQNTPTQHRANQLGHASRLRPERPVVTSPRGNRLTLPRAILLLAVGPISRRPGRRSTPTLAGTAGSRTGVHPRSPAPETVPCSAIPIGWSSGRINRSRLNTSARGAHIGFPGS